MRNTRVPKPAEQSQYTIRLACGMTHRTDGCESPCYQNRCPTDIPVLFSLGDDLRRRKSSLGRSCGSSWPYRTVSVDCRHILLSSVLLIHLNNLPCRCRATHYGIVVSDKCRSSYKRGISARHDKFQITRLYGDASYARGGNE